MSNFKENISKGKKRVIEKCGSAKNAVMDSKPVKWGMGKYNSFNKWTLGLSWMHTYYGDTREYAEKKLRKRFGLNDEEMEAGYREGFAKVMREKGQESKVKHKAIGRILLRATMAAGVSFVCDIPQIESDWFWLSLTIIGVTLVIDIVFFQRQMFLVIQELEILYVGCEKSEFEALQEKKSKIETTGDTVLQVLGWVVKNGLGYAARLFRNSLKRGLIQVLRAVGLRVTDITAETTTAWIATYAVSSLVAGIVTYVLFAWMGWRTLKALRKKMKEGADGDDGATEGNRAKAMV